MQDLTGKVNDGGATANGVLPAEQFVEIATELKNVLTSTGQTSSTLDLAQIVKAIAAYAHYGDFYTTGGTANAITLTSVGSLYAPTSYVNGMRVRFEVSSVNTGSVTINVNGIGVRTASTISGSAFTGGELPAGLHAEFVYDSSSNKFFYSNHDIVKSVLTGQTITATRLYTFPHGLGARPSRVDFFLECLTGEHGYTAGDWLPMPTHEAASQGAPDYGYSVKIDATNVYLSIDTNHTILIHQWNNDSNVAISDNFWKAHFTAYK